MKKSSVNWAVKTFVLSICLSICFSVLSQSLFPNLTSFFSLLVILFFIVISVLFDMIGVAFTTINKNNLEKFTDDKGYKMAQRLCDNKEKISSFCADVVGDICGILSGAGGVSLVVNMHINNPNVYFLVTCLISSFIAGLTIFGKAIFKGYAVSHCDVVVMKTARLIETSPITILKKKLKFFFFKKKQNKKIKK